MKQNETTTMKKPYIAPEVLVLRFSTQDVITSSTEGHDDFDNWAPDNFDI